MYLGMTGSEDWRPAVCDCWLQEKGIGGAGRGLGVGQVDMECQGYVQ